MRPNEPTRTPPAAPGAAPIKPQRAPAPRLGCAVLFGAAIWVAAVAGCGNTSPSTSTSDPQSDAPALEGRWCLQGDDQGFIGFLELDDTGDPITLQDNPLALDELGEDTLILDGARHNTSSGAQYSATAFATLDGVDVELYVELHVFSFSYESGALALKFEGERVTADRLEGITVTLQDFPGRDVPPLIVQTSTATKNACE